MKLRDDMVSLGGETTGASCAVEVLVLNAPFCAPKLVDAGAPNSVMSEAQ